MNTTEIILALISLAGVLWGGFSSWNLRKEHKRSAKLDNDNKVADSWRSLYEKSLETNASLKAEIVKETQRNDELHQKNEQLHENISGLREQLDDSRTKCAVAELLICDEVNCPKRNPPLGSKRRAEEAAREAVADRSNAEE